MKALDVLDEGHEIAIYFSVKRSQVFVHEIKIETNESSQRYSQTHSSFQIIQPSNSCLVATAALLSFATAKLLVGCDGCST